MAQELCTTQDVADLWRPFIDADEQAKVARLIVKASAKLRQKVPWIDARIARFAVDSTDLGGVDPSVVADVVATMVKRFLTNPDGATNKSETTGPYSRSSGYALRGDKDVRGEIIVTQQDIDAITPAVTSPARLRSVILRPRLAPRAYGGALEGRELAAILGTADPTIDDPGPI